MPSADYQVGAGPDDGFVRAWELPVVGGSKGVFPRFFLGA